MRPAIIVGTSACSDTPKFLQSSKAGATGVASRPDWPLLAVIAPRGPVTGALAWEIAYERWIDTANGDDFSEVARRALGEVQAASGLC